MSAREFLTLTMAVINFNYEEVKFFTCLPTQPSKYFLILLIGTQIVFENNSAKRGAGGGGGRLFYKKDGCGTLRTFKGWVLVSLRAFSLKKIHSRSFYDTFQGIEPKNIRLEIMCCFRISPSKG